MSTSEKKESMFFLGISPLLKNGLSKLRTIKKVTVPITPLTPLLKQQRNDILSQIFSEWMICKNLVFCNTFGQKFRNLWWWILKLEYSRDIWGKTIAILLRKCWNSFDTGLQEKQSSKDGDKPRWRGLYSEQVACFVYGAHWPNALNAWKQEKNAVIARLDGHE